jgi:FlaA1/EpsC-like NDP-sugar epimerase
MAAISFVLSLFLRLGEEIYFYPREQLLLALALFIVVAAVVFRSMKMYRGVWRYASLNDLLTITKAASLAILIFLVLLFAVTRLEDLPRSLPLINWFVLMALLGGPRFLYRVFKDRRLDFKLEKDIYLLVPVLLVGAGDSSELFIRDAARGESGYRAAGIVSETATRVGRDIHGVPILGTFDEIPEVIEVLTRRGIRLQRLVVSAERLQGARLRQLLDIAEAQGLSLARLPSLSDFQSGLEDQIAIKPVEVEDLLGRPQTPLDRELMQRLIAGRRVLVTGAGGSIGRELVDQISKLDPAHMTLLDNSEYALFNVERALSKNAPDLPCEAVIADVRDAQKLGRVFAAERPQLVFHAAALKHVPMVEANRLEGLATNVLGSARVADAARAAGVDTFVQISTDKAVNPTSVMGASKRMAEMYCQALDREAGGTRFVTVRFGNVLGSTGSVVELFRGQLQAGGPLSVTHPDMTRYFMTAREAVELVLQASAMGNEDPSGDGRIFVLDMGEPVRIMDLARQMIRLAGFDPDTEIGIEIIGARPGEKLFEEVLHGAEEHVATGQEGLLLARPRTQNLAVLARNIDALSTYVLAGDEAGALDILRDLVPEYAAPERPASAAQ